MIEERVYDIGAAVALEVGKNRMESLARCRKRPTSSTGIAGKWKPTRVTTASFRTIRSRDTPAATSSVLKPYGVWAVIAPSISRLRSPAGR